MKKNAGKRTAAIILSFMLLFAIGFGEIVLGQETTGKEVCPKPYIKLVKPKLARVGQEVIIRGHRFGEKEKAGEVIFSPGIGGNVISWTNSRITVTVPAGAKTGDVVVTTKCGQSDSSMIKIEGETSGEKK